jgi:lysyl-tRNA synthetase class 2
MGKSMFLDIRDQSGRIQIYAQKNVLGDELYDVFKHLDMGDFIGVKGTMFRTKTGEPSVKVEGFTIVGKSLRPPPTGWHGLEDTEIRYRQRYLDLIASDDVRKTFLNRSAIIHEIRNFFHARGYVEVETPAMQAVPGGAAAAPFKTFHNALGCEFYLRIALELYHKRLLVGGINKLFEIGKNFRNEGLSRRHNPEFTMLEAYEAFGDYETMMETVESLICQVAQKVLGTMVIKHDQTTEVRRAIIEAIAWVDKIQAYSDLESKTCPAFDAKACLSCLQLTEAKIGEVLPHELANEACVLLTELNISDTFCQSASNLSQNEQSELIHQYEKSLATLKSLSTEKTIDLTPNWKRVKYKDLVREQTRPDWFEITPAERLLYAEQVLHVEVGGRPLRKLQESIRETMGVPLRRLFDMFEQGLKFENLDTIAKKEFEQAAQEVIKKSEYFQHGVEDFEVTGAVFEKLIEPTLIQPTFVTHLPKELVPLAKLSPDDPTTVEVFECCINGQEISPGYTEQNDPIAQRATLEHQAGGEQQKLDDDFLVALEHGMPPAGGIGIGIDRLCMMLLGQESIRDVILFPQMKPK